MVQCLSTRARDVLDAWKSFVLMWRRAPCTDAAAFAAAGPSQQATRHARRVYVGGLPPTANEQNIATFFSNALAAVGGTTAGPGDDTPPPARLTAVHSAAQLVPHMQLLAWPLWLMLACEVVTMSPRLCSTVRYVCRAPY